MILIKLCECLLESCVASYEGETRQVILNGWLKTGVPWTIHRGSTIHLVDNKSIMFCKIIYPLYHFVEAGILDRVDTKDGTGFTMRYAIGNNRVNGLNVPLFFLYEEGLP